DGDLHEVGNDHGGDHGHEQGEADGLQLCHIKAAARDEFREAVFHGGRSGEVAVDVGADQDARQEGTQGATDGVDAERVERIVIAELGLELGAGEIRHD